MREKNNQKGLGFSTILFMLLLSMSAIVLLPRPAISKINIDKVSKVKLLKDKEIYIYTDEFKEEKLLIWKIEPEQPSVISYSKVDNLQYLIKIQAIGKFKPVHLVVADLNGNEKRTELYYEKVEVEKISLDYEKITF
ncbi:MAG: hypothetical protein WC275_01905 [Bacilli bacterium]